MARILAVGTWGLLILVEDVIVVTVTVEVVLDRGLLLLQLPRKEPVIALSSAGIRLVVFLLVWLDRVYKDLLLDILLMLSAIIL